MIEENDLGVLINLDLKFHRQTALAAKMANMALGLIRFAFLNEVKLPLLLKLCVRPHLEYDNVVWGPFYKGDATRGTLTEEGNKRNS